MMKASLITATAGMALTAAAAADFTGYEGVVDEIDGYYVINMYAMFDDTSNAVLNVFGADINTSDGGGFHHNDIAGGNWKPSFSFDIPGTSNPAIDSYVTVGYGVGALAALNLTALDPSFGSGAGAYIPVDAGWYNGDPNSPQYASTGSVHVGQFVFGMDRVNESNRIGFFTFDCEIGYNNGPGSGETFFGDGSWTWDVPAPGALALLGMGGLVARRRRA